MKDIFKLIISFLTHRLFVIFLSLILMFSILFSRLYELQIINGQRLEDEFEVSLLRTIEIEGQRGLIYDRNGTPLAINQIAYTLKYDNSVYTPDRNQLLLDIIRILKNHGDTLSITVPIIINKDGNYEFIESPSLVNRFKTDIYSKDMTNDEYNTTPDEMITYLLDVFFRFEENELIDKSITKEELLDLLAIRYALWAKGYYKYIPQEIAVNISEESLAELTENKDVLPGVTIVEDPIRHYLYPEYMAHIIGYTGRIDTSALEELEIYGYNQNDIVGRIGIEEAMEVYLHSIDGEQTVEVDILGRTMNVIDTQNPIAGKDVYLTIDLDLQKKAQEMLVKQLGNIISQKLVLKMPTYGEQRVPLLKDVFYNLFNNDTISILELEDSYEKAPYSFDVYNEFQDYYHEKITAVSDALVVTNPLDNTVFERYYTYILDTLEKDGYLNSDHVLTAGYEDYTKGYISLNGLLNYYIKEDFIDLGTKFNELGLNTNDITDTTIYTILVNDILIDDYFNRYNFKKNIYLEMLDIESFDYIKLSMILSEQGLINNEESRIESLLSGKTKPLDYMKTLILEIQLTPQQLALDPSSGAVVIVDVDTGEVLALVSYPSYDNNRISEYSYYQELLEDPTKPLYPTATQGKTAPGSTFKMLTAVAGLEEGVISYHDTVTCTGHFEKVTPNIACWISAYGGGHGTINVVTAIAVSCNSFFNEVGYRLGFTDDGTYSPEYGVERLRKYTEMFGLNSTSGIELIESKPSTPGTTEEGIVNPVTAAMGQEYNSYTPTQLARYMATVANGGTLYELTLIDRIYNSDGSLYENKEPTITQVNTFKEGTIEAVHEGMIEVTTGSRGTARSFYYNFPVLVGGKTGTAEENKQRASHAVFASFAPGDDPEIAIIVSIPYSYTSGFSSGYIVGTIARDLYGEYYEINKEVDGFQYSE